MNNGVFAWVSSPPNATFFVVISQAAIVAAAAPVVISKLFELENHPIDAFDAPSLRKSIAGLPLVLVDSTRSTIELSRFTSIAGTFPPVLAMMNSHPNVLTVVFDPRDPDPSYMPFPSAPPPVCHVATPLASDVNTLPMA